MNTSLKKLAGKYPKRYAVLFVILVFEFLICLAGMIATYAESGEAVLYTSDAKADDLVYVDAQYASDYFAYFTSNEGDKLYFVLDKDEKAYIVCIPDDEIERYLDLQAYTYGETKVKPEMVYTAGVLVETDEELLQMAIEEFNWFWGEEVVNSSNVKEFFGAYFIDTTVSGSGESSFLFVALFFVSAVMMIWLVTYVGGVLKKRKAIVEKADGGQVEMVDAELQGPGVKEFKKLGVYLTENYLISYRNAFGVERLDELTGIYGVITERYYQLIMRTNAGEEITAVQTDNKVNKQWDELIALVTTISEKVPGLEYGAGKVQLEGAFDLAQVENFFVARKAKPVLRIEETLTKPDGTVTAPNYPAGILCALLGALAGGVLWVFVAEIGFIAGIVGLLIVYWSLLGFKTGAKVLTKVGAIIALAVAVITIFAANYVHYVQMLTEFFGGRVNLMEIFVQLPVYLSEYELIGGFVKDLLVGYGLSALVSFSMIRNLFSEKSKVN